MHNYTLKPQKKQVQSPIIRLRTHFTQCSKNSRCHNYKKCKTCHTIYKNAQIKKLTNHLDEQSIREYKYKQYLVFTSSDTHKYENYKNADLDNFINELIRTKRNKSSVINQAQYIAIKEISYTQGMGYNPHYNFIYLSDKKFIQTKAFKKLSSKYNIKVHTKEIYKTDRSYLKSIKKIINYSLKFDKDRETIERQTNLTKGKRDIKKSALFDSDKFLDLHKRLYKYILLANAQYRAERTQARRIYRNYNKNKSSTRVRMLKSLNKKLDKAEKRRQRTIKKARQNYKAELLSLNCGAIAHNGKKSVHTNNNSIFT